MIGQGLIRIAAVIAAQGDERRQSAPLAAITAALGSNGTFALSAQEALPAGTPEALALGMPWKPRAIVGERLTVREVLDGFLIAKAKVQKSDRYLRQARYILQSFAKGRSALPFADLTNADAEKWIFGQNMEPATLRRHLAQLRTVCRWAMRKGYLAEDFTLPVELPPDLTGQRAPKITSPGDVRKIVETAFGIDANAGRHWAIRYFAGIRRAELLRLTEENINLKTGYIEVPAQVAKTRRRRLVKIEGNLRAWLGLGGELRPIDPDYLSEVRNHAGVVYTDNAPRKSFISYHVARWENAARTALQAGTSEAMVFKNYNQGAVTKEMAREFWSIAPTGKVAKVRGFKRKAHVR